MVSFKHIVHYYYYRLKREHSSNQVVHTAIFNHYNIFIIIINLFNVDQLHIYI